LCVTTRRLPTPPPFPYTTLFRSEGVCTVVNRQAVLEDRVNPFHHGEIPFLKITYNQLEGEFAGLGMVIPALDLQDEINAKRNQRLDNVNLTLNPPMKVIRRSEERRVGKECGSRCA